MNFLLRLTKTRYFVWFVLSLPFISTVVDYSGGRLIFAEVIHASGEMSARLLILALLATPLLLMFPGKAFPRWLTKNRRYLGIASFAYAVLHTAVYLEKAHWWADILDDARTPAIGAGWVALIVLLALAATSNDYAVRRLKSSWKKLHRLVYAAAVLAFVHWLLVTSAAIVALAHLTLLALFEGYRVWKLKQIATTATKVTTNH